MSTTLIFASSTITLALIFYSIGVWGEFINKRLRLIHLIFFWLGFVCDTIGTMTMGQIAKDSVVSGLNFHAVTGVAAILLMLGHAVWASVVLYKRDEKWIKSFHTFSLLVWVIWLIPFLSGMIMGMSR